jgi:hypothetical protein
MGEDGRDGAKQCANPMPVACVAREAQRDIRPRRPIGGVVTLAAKAEDRDAIAEVHELLNPLQRAGVRDVGTEEQELGAALASRRSGVAERPVTGADGKAGIVSCVD